MMVVLYDLVGRDGRRFSPHCWRTRMALEADDRVHAWFGRCLDLHGGLGRQQAGYR